MATSACASLCPSSFVEITVALFSPSLVNAFDDWVLILGIKLEMNPPTIRSDAGLDSWGRAAGREELKEPLRRPRCQPGAEDGRAKPPNC